MTDLIDAELHNLRVVQEAVGDLRARGRYGMQPKSAVHQDDPAAWVRERVDYELWSKEQEIIESVRDHKETAVHSCHDIGKSFTAGATACWWIDTHPVGEAFVVTTAPTHKQVQAILWREMNRLHTRGDLVGRMNLLEWYVGNELVAFGRKPADQSPDAFQGIHAPYVLVIFDEACGIPKTLWDAGSTLVANDGSRMLVIGNPDDPHSEFAKVCQPDSGWNVIHIGYEHTPNFTDEPVSDAVAASLISRDWVESKKLRWGERSALFQSKCLGVFPTEGGDGVIPYAWASQCRYTELPAQGVRCAGLDVGGGSDRTVLRERIGPYVGREMTWVEADPMKVCGKIAETLVEWDTERVVVDVIGIGWGLTGRLKELSTRHNYDRNETTHDAEVVGFNAAEASKNPVRFANKRAEMHWNGRELSRLKLWNLENVDDDVLAELTESKYEIMDSKGKIKVEKKNDVAKRLDGNSPDRGDALLMAFWEGDVVAANLPASASDLRENRYSGRPDTGIAGPVKKPKTKTVAEERRREEEMLRGIMRSQRV